MSLSLEYTGPLWGRREVEHEFIVGVHGAALGETFEHEFVVGVHGAAVWGDVS